MGRRSRVGALDDTTNIYNFILDYANIFAFFAQKLVHVVEFCFIVSLARHTPTELSPIGLSLPDGALRRTGIHNENKIN